MIYHYLPFKRLRTRLHRSERRMGADTFLSRGALRNLEEPDQSNLTIGTIHQLAHYFDREVEVLISPREIRSDVCTVAVANKVDKDGVDSWKIHFFDFVDEFRRTVDPRLLLLPPPAAFDSRLSALLASIVLDLCAEVQMVAPAWATQRRFLPRPWFVSGVNSLKATAILESPLPYRSNNIFVQANFLSRA